MATAKKAKVALEVLFSQVGGGGNHDGASSLRRAASGFTSTAGVCEVNAHHRIYKSCGNHGGTPCEHKA